MTTELSENAKEWLGFLGLNEVKQRGVKFFVEAETSPNDNLRWEMHQYDWEDLGEACTEIAAHLASLSEAAVKERRVVDGAVFN